MIYLVSHVAAKRDDAEAVGFVHYRRINGNRLRIPAFVDDRDIVMIMTPYEIMQKKSLYR